MSTVDIDATKSKSIEIMNGMWGMINEAKNYKEEFKDDKLQPRAHVRIMSVCRVYGGY